MAVTEACPCPRCRGGDGDALSGMWLTCLSRCWKQLRTHFLFVIFRLEVPWIRGSVRSV